MPPVPAIVSRAFSANPASGDFSTQWKNPADIFSVLLILGGDVVSRALAQLGGSCFTPVAFSFGWVAFAVTAVVSAVGENKLMPPADFSCKVINGKTGYTRDNRSWIVGRIVRDFETWMDKQPRKQRQSATPHDQSQKTVQIRVQELIESKWNKLKVHAKAKGEPEPERPPKAGLCVSVYMAQKAIKGYPGYDAPYITGIFLSIVQLGVAAIPCGMFNDWSILMVTAAGIVLSFSSGALSQWSKEKWPCRSNTRKTFVLTTGSGSQHAIVIQGGGVGLDLEDLAANAPGAFTSQGTRAAIIVLCVFWILLLITAAGVKQHTWFLLAVGALGILQNVFAAGVSRSPKAFGIPLEFVEVIGEPKVMDTLFEVETRYPCLGKSLLPIFFPGELHKEEQAKWNSFDSIAKLKAREEKKKREESNNSEISRSNPGVQKGKDGDDA